jgi:hypothetical protein
MKIMKAKGNNKVISVASVGNKIVVEGFMLKNGKLFLQRKFELSVCGMIDAVKLFENARYFHSVEFV